MGDPLPAAAPPLVLVVDDEPMVRSLMRATLSETYRVLEAADGTEALAVYGALGGQISAVVTDLRMPRMDGLTLASLLRRAVPAPPILFVSGFDGGGELPGPLLTKPFLPSRLLEALEALLATRH
jgi:two-component system, cell cycle sensor histidine kinase and response regulator CckA